MKPLLIIGSSGHAKAVLEIVEALGHYRVIGLLDSFEAEGSEKDGYPICGRPEDAAILARTHGCRTFFVAIGDNWQRWRVASDVRRMVPGVEFPALVHPTSIVSRTARIGSGSAVMPAAYLGVNTFLGEGCIVNVASSVNHDCRLDDYSSLSAGVHLGGASSIGFRSSMGLGSTLREKATVGSDTVVGLGAAVLEDVPDGVVVFGVPAKVRRQRPLDDRYMR